MTAVSRQPSLRGVPDTAAQPARWPIAVLIAISLVWIALGRTTYFVGPSEWDDNLYCDLAAIPRGLFEVANRYVHIWTLHIFFLLIDSRQDAAGWYATLVTVGLMWAGFFLGRRVAGTGCGLLAAALMPLRPGLLWYMSVPYPDPPMAMWGAWALVCAMAAADAATSRRRACAIVAAGLFCFLSVKCKETGLAILPPVAVALWPAPARLRTLGLWVLGALAGWLLLSVADGVFMKDFWWSWRPSSYVPKPGDAAAPGTIRESVNYFDILFSTEFLAFTLLGGAGAALGFRQHRGVRCVALWSFAALAFLSLISCRYLGLHALDRYSVAAGVPLVVLSAYWITSVWNRAACTEAGSTLGWALAALLTCGFAFYGLCAELLGKAGPYVRRFDFFMTPLAMIVLFLSPWLVGGRRWVRGALVLLIAATALVSLKGGREYVLAKRQIIAPWETLADAMDHSGTDLARWRLPSKPYAAFRIARRCRSLSERPATEIEVRDIESLEQIRENEWLFSSPEVAPEVRKLGWVPFIRGAEQGGTFVVYRRERKS